jgi:hypothetical protein
MLVAFQGFPAPPGGKKTGAVMENVFVLGYRSKNEFQRITAHYFRISVVDFASKKSSLKLKSCPFEIRAAAQKNKLTNLFVLDYNK